MAEDAENMTRNARELVLSQKTPTGEEDVQRMIDATYKVEIGFNKEGWFCARIPLLIPKKDGYSVKYLENRLRAVLHQFWDNRLRINFSYRKIVIVFRHVYAFGRPAWERCVPVDGEIDCVIRLLFQHVFCQIYPVEFLHYHCCAISEEERTEVYVMPVSDLGKWLAQETPIAAKGGTLYESIADARKDQNEESRKD